MFVTGGDDKLRYESPAAKTFANAHCLAGYNHGAVMRFFSVNRTFAKTRRLITGAAAVCVCAGFALPAGAQITFEQVFAAPENAQLNLDYAKQEAAAGNLLQAASTLERLLYAEPNWDSARLFYAEVLLRLDDRQGASRELVLLETRPLTPAQQEDLLAMSTVVTGAPAKSDAGLKARLKIGVRYDDNGANALTDVVGGARDEDDIAMVVRGSVSGKTLIASGLNLIGGVGASFRLPSDNASRSYSGLSANIGIGGGDAAQWTARFGARTVALESEKFLTEAGPRGSLTVPISDGTKLNFGGAAVYQTYESLPGSPNERFRSGQKFSLMGSVSHKLSAKTRIGASLQYDDKRAKADIFAYDAWRLGGTVFHTVDEDRYISGGASYRALDYDGVNGFANPPVARDDDHIYVRAAYGIRLSALSDMFSTADTVFLEGAVDVIDRKSNISAFDYDNVGAELSLTWEF